MVIAPTDDTSPSSSYAIAIGVAPFTVVDVTRKKLSYVRSTLPVTNPPLHAVLLSSEPSYAYVSVAPGPAMLCRLPVVGS